MPAAKQKPHRSATPPREVDRHNQHFVSQRNIDASERLQHRAAMSSVQKATMWGLRSLLHPGLNRLVEDQRRENSTGFRDQGFNCKDNT
eukprot:3269680-Amphidinium_carterae.1